MQESSSSPKSRSQTDQPPASLSETSSEKADRSGINLLLLAVIQMQDQRKTVQMLKQIGLNVIRLASSGGFLGQRNTTLLIGLPDGKLSQAMDVIHEYCHQRVEYVSTPLEGAPMPIPIATPITVGGATVFALEVERVEEF